jgi:hypothetical protein
MQQCDARDVETTRTGMCSICSVYRASGYTGMAVSALESLQSPANIEIHVVGLAHNTDTSRIMSLTEARTPLWRVNNYLFHQPSERQTAIRRRRSRQARPAGTPQQASRQRTRPCLER